MKVLVVDDQRLSRAGIIKMVDWDRLALQLAGECSNGQETLDFLADHEVDIVITDVRMPILGGLELIEQAKELYPHISFIVTSGYDDFAYVRKSIQLTVADYLLKPVDGTELNTLLEQLMNKMAVAQQKEQLWLQTMREQFFYLLLENAYTDIDTIVADWQDIQLAAAENAFLTAVFDSERSTAELKLYFEQVYPTTSSFILRLRGSFVIILVGTSEQIHHSIEPLHTLLARRDYCQLTGIGIIVEGVEHLQQSFHAAYDAYTLQASIHPITDAAEQTSSGGSELEARTDSLTEAALPLSAVWEREWSLVLKQGNRTAIINKVDELHQMLQAASHDGLVDSVYPYILLRGVRELYEANLLQEPAYIEALQMTKKLPFIIGLDEKRNIITDFFFRSLETDSQHHTQEVKESIQKAKEYMELNFHQSINLTDLAQTFYMSPGYFSSMFRQHVGRNYLDYLTYLRIEHAKQLMAAHPASKIGDIAIQCGYQDIKHFRSLFKRHTGVTPLKYKEDMQLAKESAHELESDDLQ